jgi:hypothetical protein
VRDNPFFVDSSTSFAVQPSVVMMCHFGRVFLGGDGRWLVTPSPATFALFVSGGVGFWALASRARGDARPLRRRWRSARGQA